MDPLGKARTFLPSNTFPKIRGTLFWGLDNKYPTIWGTILDETLHYMVIEVCEPATPLTTVAIIALF